MCVSYKINTDKSKLPSSFLSLNVVCAIFVSEKYVVVVRERVCCAVQRPVPVLVPCEM